MRSESVAISRRALVRATAVVPVSATALGLAACGASGPTNGTSTTSAAPVSFQYWDWAPVWKDLVEELAKQYSGTRSNVTVQWEIQAADYWTKLQVAVAGDTAPDSWRMNGPNLPQWSSLGLLEDLTPYINKDKDAAANLKAMSPAIADYTRRSNKQWTMPFGQAISGIIAYNTDILRSEGLAPPAELWAKGGWTWQTLQEYAVKLTRRDGSRHGYYVDRGSETGWLPFVNANGGSLFNKEGKRSAVNSAEAREALEYLANLGFKLQVTPSPQELTQEKAENRFLNGRLAMWPQGSWQIKDLNLKAKSIKWDLVPAPLAPQTKKNGGTNQMASLAMAKTSKQKDTVWDWQKYVGSKAGQDTIARAEYFPARTDSAEQIYYKTEVGPPSRPLMRDVLKVVQALPWLDVAGNTGGWGPIVNPLIGQMFDGQLGTREGVQQMHDQLNAAIDRGFK